VSAGGTTALRDPRKVRSALLRYQVFAWATGFGLVVLTYALLRYPAEWLFDAEIPGAEATSRVLGPIHGTLYIILLITTFDLGSRVRWPWSRMVLTALAGTIPFLSFYAERKNARAVRSQLAAGQPGA
jgi:integral membrane protein